MHAIWATVVLTKKDEKMIATRQGWAYLSAVKDLFDGFIVAHHVSWDDSIGLVLRTLQIAKQRGRKLDGLLLHSDQGSPFRSDPYQALLTTCGITPSMSRRGNCWDDAPIENFFSHLKEEALRPFCLLSFHDLQQLIEAYVQFFNYERIQLKTRQTLYQLRCLSA